MASFAKSYNDTTLNKSNNNNNKTTTTTTAIRAITNHRRHSMQNSKEKTEKVFKRIFG